MSFGDRIKRIRKEQDLTQEQFSEKISVSRQAVSNWENDRNLPDIEMLITISNVFHISLDQLILGENDMNNMTEKLIKDGSDTRRAKMNLISACIGAALFVIGIACIVIKAVSVEYIDASGVLHENFFLLPVAFAFLFGGFITFFVTGVRNVVGLICDKTKTARKNKIIYISLSLSIVILCVALLLVLHAANS